MSSESAIFDVMVKGEKKCQAFDVNPVVISTDEQCKFLLEQLKNKLTLTDSQASLLDLCLAVVSAQDGDNVEFGPGEIVGLSELAQCYPDSATEIMACSHHLTESVDCDGELPSNIYLEAALAYGELSNIMSAALKAGPISQDTNIPDEDFEEELTDDDDYYDKEDVNDEK